MDKGCARNLHAEAYKTVVCSFAVNIIKFDRFSSSGKNRDNYHVHCQIHPAGPVQECGPSEVDEADA